MSSKGMSFSIKKHDRLRERMSAHSGPAGVEVPSVASRGGSGKLPERIAELQKDRKSFAHLRQSMIVPPRALEWWEKEVVEYAFSHPYVRARLERLMGSNITRLTDRRYMQRLAERIQEEHEIQLAKRIRAREEAEVEREKKLILEGKIPVEQVPHELADHPVFKISRITSQAIEFRRSKVQHPTMRASYIPEGTLQALAKAMSTVEEDEAEEVQMLHEPVASEGEMIDVPSLVEEMVDQALEDAEIDEYNEDEAVHTAALQADALVDVAVDVAEGLVTPPEELTVEQQLRRRVVQETLDETLEKVAVEEEEEDEEEAARRAAKHASQQARATRRKRLSQKEMGSLSAKEDFSKRGGEPLDASERASLAAMLAARIEWEAEQAAFEEEARRRDKEYMLSETEFRRLKYEAPLIEELRKKETVADLYRLADEIVGGLWIGKAKRPSQVTQRGSVSSATPSQLGSAVNRGSVTSAASSTHDAVPSSAPPQTQEPAAPEPPKEKVEQQDSGVEDEANA